MDISGLVHAFFNSPGPGGVVVVVVFTTALLIYYFLARWFLAGADSQPADGASSEPGKED